MSKILDSKAAMVGVGVLALGVVVYLIGRQLKGAAGAAAAAVGQAINPGSDKNLAYRAVTAVGAAASQDEGWTLGGWLYDVTHPAYDPNKGFSQAPQRLTEGGDNTDALWGPIGGVVLRSGS